MFRMSQSLVPLDSVNRSRNARSARCATHEIQIIYVYIGEIPKVTNLSQMKISCGTSDTDLETCSRADHT
jgi:hypothetical protein